MPTLSIVNFNIVCATLGGFITVFGLVSYLLKEKFYLSEALISLVAGLIFSPHATNFIRPLDYALGDYESLETITLYFTRLVLGVQLVLAGVQLPSKYLKKEWKSLAWLLGPGMCGMWIATSLLVWGLVPDINFLFALAIGASVTPTDPILSNSIVKGKFADKNIPRELQKIIVAESGANDGLGYPFLFLPLYLIKYVGNGGAGQTGGASKAMGLWFGETWAYTIILSVVYGAAVGYVAKELLHWAEERKYVDRESFLVFAITLALFIVGTVGMIGSDDVLACFIAGNVFTWDDWFRLETLDDSLQPTIDMLLNVAIFIWFGAITPWYEFAHNNVIPIYRLVLLGILVLLLRRLPVVFALHKKIHQIEQVRQALFVGFFGPIGVSAIFYLYVSREFLRGITVDGVQREDAAKLSETMLIVIWFLAVCSMVVHGVSIPLGKIGFYLPRTISAAISSERITANASDDSIQPQPVSPLDEFNGTTQYSLANRFHRTKKDVRSSGISLSRSIHQLGRNVISTNNAQSKVSSATGPAGIIGSPQNPRRIGKAIKTVSSPSPSQSRSSWTRAHDGAGAGADHADQQQTSANNQLPVAPATMTANRSVRFPDEEVANKQ